MGMGWWVRGPLAIPEGMARGGLIGELFWRQVRKGAVGPTLLWIVPLQALNSFPFAWTATELGMSVPLRRERKLNLFVRVV